ncbi:citrate synthase/methylcitrate synthase [Actinoalloteichus hymeniacidonis]|uniref:Citrate synthase n=1 Tax=Actinoalloteichus hymeniacidonis TaxID=340345 RepID=A0AAC9HQG0_9PSEU|nr:citrate synthase/methylcitrate synthase [Actinoalloteichus hymeniacidonis]AOS63459.1 citrate synthase [Actinoalloteichus hymeniacidonis]MBB5908499.1 citrate synthase [Actinoalloteichus hymeniacidonis]
METTVDGPIEVPAGLRNVIVTTTEVGDVRGSQGFYHYRQYSAIDLARTRSFEEVWFLLIEGRLPDSAELADFVAELTTLRALPEELTNLLPTIAAAGAKFDPMSGLRTALSVLGTARDLLPLWDSEPTQRRADALLICAATPTILAALHRLRAGLEPVEPRADLSCAANWLWMITGSESAPAHARAVESYLIATIDHGFNASTFTARVVASTGADVASAVTAAIGSFSGPLHGGAPDRALDSLDEIGAPDRIDPWVRAQVESGGRIMGFGHPVYRTADPRAVLLRTIAEELGGDLVEFATTVERRVVEILAELKPGRELHANVEFYAGVVMELCGIPRRMFTPTFATSRVVGWTANILEQAAGGRLIRPSARYVGPPAPAPVPVRRLPV